MAVEIDYIPGSSFESILSSYTFTECSSFWKTSGKITGWRLLHPHEVLLRLGVHIVEVMLAITIFRIIILPAFWVTVIQAKFWIIWFAICVIIFHIEVSVLMWWSKVEGPKIYWSIPLGVGVSTVGGTGWTWSGYGVMGIEMADTQAPMIMHE
jgi:hypothetical protein